MSIAKEALKYHREPKPGKIEVVPSKPCLSQNDLSLAYTPGVGAPCLEIQKDPDLSYEYTSRGNLVGVITNGTAVLGLGNIGPLAGKPFNVLQRSTDMENVVNVIAITVAQVQENRNNE